MPQPVATEVMKEDVAVTSTDGTRLEARVYRPSEIVAALPSVLISSPYWNGSQRGAYFKEQEDIGTREYADCLTPFLLRRGYAVVLADMRASRHSEGCFDYGGRGDQQDGYALVQWISSQSWSNGNVGMYGISHPGYAAYAAAVASPPALRAIIPVAPVSSYYRSLYSGGARYATTFGGYNAYYEAVSALPGVNVGSPSYAANAASAACNTESFAHAQSLDGTMDAYWRERDMASHASRISAAVFHVHGTRDENVKMDHFSSIWRAMEAAGTPRKALIGPWGHGPPRVANWELIALRWFEHWLRHNDTGVMDEPALTLIDQFGNSRVSEEFESGPHLVLEAGQGQLSDDVPSSTAQFKALPVPEQLLSSGGNAFGLALSYTGSALTEDLRIGGSPRLILHAAIDSPDTNFGARLYDLAPDGAATYVTRGYVDARHRLDEPRRDIVPGEVRRYEIELHAREYVVRVGHRLRLVLFGGTEIDALTAENTGVLPGAAVPTVAVAEGKTRLVLPLAD